MRVLKVLNLVVYCAFCISIFVTTQSEAKSLGRDFDFKQVYKVLTNTIRCLKQTPILNENATFVVVQGLGYLHEVFETVPNFSGKRRKLVEDVERELEVFIERSLAANPHLPAYHYRPQYYGQRTDVRFRAGNVDDYSPLSLSFMQVLQHSLGTPFLNQCLNDLLSDNGNSPDLRECVAKCDKEMTVMDYYSGPPAEDKAWYVGYEMITNCSNHSPLEYRRIVSHFCKHVKREVDTMLLNRRQKQFQDSIYYFKKKVLYCSAWGMPEFLSPKIITTIINNIDCRGCVGSNRGPEDKQVLTAQTMSILATTLRYVIERDYASGAYFNFNFKNIN